MDIWLRIIATFAKCLWRPKLKPTDTVEDTYVVGPMEADFRLMGNARYLLFAEVARLEMMIRTGAFRHARNNKWAPLVTAQSIRYKRSLKRFQRFTLRSRLVAWNEKWFFVEHTFLRRGNVCAYAMVKGCFRGAGGVVPPAEVFRRLGEGLESPRVPEHFVQWDAAEAAHERSITQRNSQDG